MKLLLFLCTTSVFFLLLEGMILPDNSEIEKKIEKCKIQTKSPKLFNLIAMNLIESYSKPEDLIKMKMSHKQWKNISGPLNLFPNESSIQLFRHNETNELIWVDSNHFIRHEIKEEIEHCLLHKEDARAENCLFDCIKRGFYPVSAAEPFIRELIFFHSEHVDFEGYIYKHPLSLAALYGVEKAITKLIERGANVEATDRDGKTSLYFAASYGHAASCKLLLQGGANVDTQRESGMSALGVASRNGHLAVVKFLLKSGANVNMKNNDNYSALHSAAANGNPEVVKVLLEAGANTKKLNHKGETALEEAVDTVKRWTKYKEAKIELHEAKNCVDILKQHEAKNSEISKKNRKHFAALVLSFLFIALWSIIYSIQNF